MPHSQYRKAVHVADGVTIMVYSREDADNLGEITGCAIERAETWQTDKNPLRT
ncbi:MAG: hypothetical protein IH945_08435 [Armatimonadetes bacterium]|nr:hypothetical protein [Armatimonadota bacterium]